MLNITILQTIRTIIINIRKNNYSLITIEIRNKAKINESIHNNTNKHNHLHKNNSSYLVPKSAPSQDALLTNENNNDIYENNNYSFQIMSYYFVAYRCLYQEYTCKYRYRV